MIENREALNLAGAFVAIALVTILAFVTWALIFKEVPKPNENTLQLLIGILSANVGVVVGFFFGSSVSNRKQTDTIDTLAKTAQTAGAALGSSPESMVIPPDTSATVTPTDAGAVIEKASTGDNAP